jgi:hypothetical protein
LTARARGPQQRQILILHDEVDDIPAFPAAEAIEDLLFDAQVKEGVFSCERTQAPCSPLPPFSVHVLRYDSMMFTLCWSTSSDAFMRTPIW